MTDIDFDELDKAVSSLMDQTPEKEPTPKNAPVSNYQPEQPVAPQTPQAPVADPVVKQPESAKLPAEDKPVSNITKRRGQFMDVMHHSSDMTTGKQLSKSSKRIGTSLNPVSQNFKPEQAEITSNNSPQVEELSRQTNDAPLSPANMPDPLEMQYNKPVSETTAPIVIPNDSGAQSPFLSDAKVEKKPLGSAAPTAAPADISKDTFDKKHEQDVQSQESTEPLPAEFANDVLKAESDTKLHQRTVQSAVAPAVSLAPTAVSVSEPHNSIVQQYKEKKTDESNKVHAPMYDSTTEPLAHPAKKKSGWIVVVVIILLIALGAGSAAALYFLNIL